MQEEGTKKLLNRIFRLKNVQKLDTLVGFNPKILAKEPFSVS